MKCTSPSDVIPILCICVPFLLIFVSYPFDVPVPQLIKYKCFRVEASRPLTEPEIIPMPYVTENNRITLVMPVVQDELVEAVDFVKRYKFPG